MPYITKENITEKRKAIKKAFPKFKFSITRKNYSTIDINILEGNIDFGTNYEHVNHFYIKEHYSDKPEIRDVLLKIYNIADSNNGVETEDADYGTVPKFYIDISIGNWDKPYVCKK